MKKLILIISVFVCFIGNAKADTHTLNCNYTSGDNKINIEYFYNGSTIVNSFVYASNNSPLYSYKNGNENIENYYQNLYNKLDTNYSTNSYFAGYINTEREQNNNSKICPTKMYVTSNNNKYQFYACTSYINNSCSLIEKYINNHKSSNSKILEFNINNSIHKIKYDAVSLPTNTYIAAFSDGFDYVEPAVCEGDIGIKTITNGTIKAMGCVNSTNKEPLVNCGETKAERSAVYEVIEVTGENRSSIGYAWFCRTQQYTSAEEIPTIDDSVSAKFDSENYVSPTDCVNGSIKIVTNGSNSINACVGDNGGEPTITCEVGTKEEILDGTNSSGSIKIGVCRKPSNSDLVLEGGDTDFDFDISKGCESYLGNPHPKANEPKEPAYYLQFVFDLIKYAALVLLFILTIVEFGKAAVSNNQDAMKKALQNTIKRLIIAVIIFFLPILIEFLFELLGIYSAGTCGIS